MTHPLPGLDPLPPGTPAEPLAVALRRAATVLDAEPLPPALAAATLAEAARRRGVAAGKAEAATTRVRAVAPWRRWAAWSGGAAVLATLLLAATVLVLAPPAADPAARPASVAGFVPLVPAADWPADGAPAWLVETELTPARLAALGLPYDPAEAAQARRAEVLVQASGRVLALRVVD